jgi:hypothetical protein
MPIYYGLLSTSTSLITEGLKTAFSTAVSQVQTDVGSMMATALPAGLVIMGGFLAIRLGVNFFKSVAN